MKPTIEQLTAQFTQLLGERATVPVPAAPAAAPARAAAAAPAPVATVTAAPAPAADAAPTAAAAKPAVATGPAPAAPVSATPSPATAAAPVSATPPPPAQPDSGAGLRPALLQTTHALKGYDFDVTVAPDQVVAAATILDFDGFGLDAVTGVDWLAQGQMEVVYDYFHPTESLHVVVRTRLPRATPEVPTISNVFPGANWHERETHDFFGITFTGHPNLKPFLLPEDADFHPLRKDYTP